MINPGDTLAVSISDPPQGFTTVIRDLTTHQTGFMTASAANGFANTNMSDCSGTPHTFHAEYSTASIQNQVPWAALEGGVLMEQEIGHSEVCNSVSNQDPFTASYPGGQSYSDPNVFDTCVGGSEEPTATGEGPCPSTGCQNATTQGPNGPTACSTSDPASGALCEFADGFCFQKGARTALVNGVPTTEYSDANQCTASRYQNGDLDFDGLDYVASSWPNGSRNHPTAFQYVGPFQANGRHTTRRSSSRPTSAARRTCATWPPAPGVPHRRSARSSTRTGRSASSSTRSGRTSPRACGTSARTCRTPLMTSGRTLSTARLTWPLRRHDHQHACA